MKLWWTEKDEGVRVRTAGGSTVGAETVSDPGADLSCLPTEPALGPATPATP